MGNQLNAFQVYVLRKLNDLLFGFVDISFDKSIWLSCNLTDTMEKINEWVKNLVDAGFIEEKINKVDIFMLTLPGNEKMAPTFSTYTITQPGREYLASLTVLKKEINKTIESTTHVNPTIALVAEHLKCLKGKWNGRKMMSDADYEKLVEYTVHLIDNNSLPAQVAKIPNTNISKWFLQETYYRLYKRCSTSVDRNKFIKFLHKVFEQFSGCKESTTTAKFSSYPGNYEHDKSLIE